VGRNQGVRFNYRLGRFAKKRLPFPRGSTMQTTCKGGTGCRATGSNTTRSVTRHSPTSRTGLFGLFPQGRQEVHFTGQLRFQFDEPF
jgi:hypothetical protein